jgi:hypothetical protein
MQLLHASLAVVERIQRDSAHDQHGDRQHAQIDIHAGLDSKQGHGFTILYIDQPIGAATSPALAAAAAILSVYRQRGAGIQPADLLSGNASSIWRKSTDHDWYLDTV